MCEKFCNLHSHSYYSTLDGFGSPERMVKRAVSLGQPAIALTEHGNMSSAIDLKRACESHGIKYVPGIELYIAPWGRDVHWRRDDNKRTGTGQHLTVWAYNQQGYQNMLKLTQLANQVGFFHVPRIDYSMLERYSDGLIVTSGCMASAICSALNPETGVKASDYRLVNNVFGFMMDVFGLDRYFIEIQGHDIPALRDINLELFRVNKHYGYDYVVTNDSHYAYPEDNVGQVDVMCVSQKCSRLSPNEFIYNTFVNKAYYMPDISDLLQRNYGFDVPYSAFTNTIRIADMVEAVHLGYEPEVKQYRFPVMPEYSHDYDGVLSEIAFDGLEGKYPVSNKYTFKAGDRLTYELGVIKSLGFASYFLCVYDIKRYCDERRIPMTVRGSAGGSIVLYCLGVTDFCPLEYDLLFERFLNFDRVSAPDADLDIDPSRRAEVIKYLVQKYGDDYVAQVVNFNFIKGRGAIRDATRLNEAPYDMGDAMIARMNESVKASVKGTVSEESEYYVSDFVKSPLEGEILETALRIEGQIRSVGIHAGAVMLSDRPLVMDYPLMRPKGTSRAVTESLVAFNYEIAESIGGIKLDILGVSALGILYQTIKLINNRHGKNYTFETLPVDDPDSFELINSGHLSEIFQLTGYTARAVTAQIQPKNVRDVMAINAIARPGPLQYAQQFADRLHGREKVTYAHPDLCQVLAETQGIIVYQEQIMRISQLIAGFTGNEADTLRKAVSKKKGFDKIRDKFITGGISNGYDSEFIENLWDDILHFAGYGFNASHACAYSRIAVKLAYVKAHYPIEFYASALTGRANDDVKLDELLIEMSHFGIKLLPPRLGKSLAKVFAIDDDSGGVRYPYGSVKNVGKAGNYLEHIRLDVIHNITDEQLALFAKAGKKPLESLAIVGAFDHLFPTRNDAVMAIDYLSKGLPPIRQAAFLPEQDRYTQAEFYALERALTGLYLTGHPLDQYDLTNQIPFDRHEVYETLHDEIGMFIGVVNKIHLHRDRKNNIMAFVDIEDQYYNTITVVIFASLYEEVEDDICLGCVCKVLGKINVRYGRDDEEEAKLKKYGRVSIVAANII